MSEPIRVAASVATSGQLREQAVRLALRAKLGLAPNASDAQVRAAAQRAVQPVAASAADTEAVLQWAVDTRRIPPYRAAAYRAQSAAGVSIRPILEGLAPACLAGETAAYAAGPVTVRAAARSGPEYALNPLVDELRAHPQGGAVLCSSTGAASTPTLFESGDLPPFTASGMDPRNLLSVPWFARHAIAAAGPAEAYQLLQDASGPDGLVAASLDDRFTGHPGNADYQSRVTSWMNAEFAADGQRTYAAAQNRQHRDQVAAAAERARENPQPSASAAERKLYRDLFGEDF